MFRLAIALWLAFPLLSQQVFIEAESFRNLGGWVVDQQFMDQMGSPFLLAHGMGTPVEDARTEVPVPAAGSYRIWVRTREWAAAWGTHAKAPGRFQLVVNGQPLNTIFGSEGVRWHWRDGGAVRLGRGKAAISLNDLTGFDGRCDAILLTLDASFRPPDEGAALASYRRKAAGLPEIPADGGSYDLVVVGGGIAGTATAIAAARLGLQVALIQDRPLLGGNNSSEVRVHLSGNAHLEPFPALGGIVDELDPDRCHGQHRRMDDTR